MVSDRGARILGLLAIVSVAINLFLAGSIVGGRFRGPPPPPGFERRLDEAWDELPPADKAIAQQVYGQRRDDIAQKWRATRGAVQKAGRGIQAKTFNGPEVQADLDASNARFIEFRKAVQDMFFEIAGKISPEGRQRLRAPGGAL